jgi:DNA polymerase delta subunit 2
MPGSQDFSNAYLPQQPINSFLFPRLDTREQINFVTNPHKFEMSGVDFIGTSG